MPWLQVAFAMVADRRYTSRMIIRARTVVTMDAAPIDNGAVAVSEGRIVDVGKFDELKKRNAGEIVDLGEQSLLPGLINAHCHLDYTCLRGKIPPPKTFADWIRAINAEKARLSPKDYLSSINSAHHQTRSGYDEQRAISFGNASRFTIDVVPKRSDSRKPSAIDRR